MEYRYNYKFLQSWMTENNISNRRVLEAIGTQDNKSMNSWKNGERPMPVGGYSQDSTRKNRQNINPAPRFHQQAKLPAEYPSMPITKEDTKKSSDPEDDKDKDNGNNTPEPVPTPIITSEDTENIALLKMELKCQQEIMRIKDEARAHETAMRTEFIKRNEKLREKLYEVINSQNETIKLLNDDFNQIYRPTGEGQGK